MLWLIGVHSTIGKHAKYIKHSFFIYTVIISFQRNLRNTESQNSHTTDLSSLVSGFYLHFCGIEIYLPCDGLILWIHPDPDQDKSVTENEWVSKWK